MKRWCGKGAKQIPFSQVPLDKACAYAAEDADICLRLWMMLKPRLAQEGMSSVYHRLERPLISVLADMEKKVFVSIGHFYNAYRMIFLSVLRH